RPRRPLPRRPTAVRRSVRARPACGAARSGVCQPRAPPVPVTEVVPTAEFASVVYGSRGVALDDPAEAFHEASRLYPNVAPGRIEALHALARSPALQQTVARASRTHGQRPALDLPRGALPRRASFGAVLEARRSTSSRVARRLRLRDLAAVLEASYASLP